MTQRIPYLCEPEALIANASGWDSTWFFVCIRRQRTLRLTSRHGLRDAVHLPSDQLLMSASSAVQDTYSKHKHMSIHPTHKYKAFASAVAPSYAMFPESPNLNASGGQTNHRSRAPLQTVEEANPISTWSNDPREGQSPGTEVHRSPEGKAKKAPFRGVGSLLRKLSFSRMSVNKSQSGQDAKWRSSATSKVSFVMAEGTPSTSARPDSVINAGSRDQGYDSGAAKHLRDSLPREGTDKPDDDDDDEMSEPDFSEVLLPPETQDVNSDELDLINEIPGFFRVLDLITERGSGGLVDKVLISQEGLRSLIDSLYPGAYTALTKVDFNALDTISVRPIGVYGDKSEIIRFFRSLKIIDARVELMLTKSEDDSTGPVLRSGIYIVRDPKVSDILYVVYWPQDTTWMDDAPSGPRRNRITFIRYLTKICDQIWCLMSPAQSEAFVWDNREPESSPGSALDFAGMGQERLYTFEITTTNEQEENVVPRQGFSVLSKLMVTLDYSPDGIPLSPCLMAGETGQAFLSARFVPPRTEKRLVREFFTSVRLRQVLTSSIVKINCLLTTQAIETLIAHGLDRRYPEVCREWVNRQKAISKESERQKLDARAQWRGEPQGDVRAIEKQLFSFLISQILERYPTLDPASFAGPLTISREEFHRLNEELKDPLKNAQVERLHPQVTSDFKARISKLPAEFHEQMRRIICVGVVNRNFPDYYNDDFVKSVIQKGVPNRLGGNKSTISSIFSAFPTYESDDSDINLKVVMDHRLEMSTAGDFLACADQYTSLNPLLELPVGEVMSIAYKHLSTALVKAFDALMPIASRRQQDTALKELDERLNAIRHNHQTASACRFAEQINTASHVGENLPIFTLAEFDCPARGAYIFNLMIEQEIRISPGVEHRINLLEILDDHRHQLQLDPSFIPTPLINQNRSTSFIISLRDRVLHAQVLPRDKILIIIDSKRDRCFRCYLEDVFQISLAIAYRRDKRKIQKGKIGESMLVAVDETQRMLVLCAPQKLVLHVFMIDEQFISLQNLANPFELSSWYDEPVTIVHMCCVAGAEEVFLVDSKLQGRVYSLVSQRFRPASISLPRMPVAVMSSPDGACALLLFQEDRPENKARYLVAYHWATFGATRGITIPLPEDYGSVAVTSFVHRQSVYLMMMNDRAGYCRSLALDISKKSSEYMFREKGKRVGADVIRGRNCVNNCLIDCFKDVWTRFPVVAAISRQTFGPSTHREPKKITFVSDQRHDKYASYFADLIKAFEEETKKPTGGQLAATIVDSKTSSEASQAFKGGLNDIVSQFPAGQWLVDLLCLLPIHIAVARENRFIPLKDGVTSVKYERSLLGAELRQIVDTLSFGWYESILQSYMVDKPVRVVSSMGEQSVGKSYSLNHLMDTSFAGSAMRTTEGVWMSITPTDEALLVALDFEGVHSIERSPQEDALLVLFNTAISNLVLFRNNFALSRDITNLFQSFQASSTILDPASNPSLFRSTLVVIIKDVVESDQREIVREFSSKFQQMVQAEQETNFISKLHAGKLNIIPWPIIESHQFYSLFAALGKTLMSQEISHSSAGEFLHTLKTLMGKLKTNDWGAMSQTLAAHRAQSLLDVLPIALEYGMAAVEPNLEPLKNFDNNSVVDHNDTPLRLFLTKHAPDHRTDDREVILLGLQKSWSQYGVRKAMDERSWVLGLEAHLADIVKRRTDHVNAWIADNLKRFKSARASLENVQREMGGVVIDLQTNIELCKFGCSRCNLFCTLSRKHDPDQLPHNCGTDHQCTLPCDYAKDHQDQRQSCRSPAGHDGPHVCDVNKHLCGKVCARGKQKGCQGGCTQMVGHNGDHMCSSRKHACGQPCTLRTHNKHKGKVYVCPGTCDISCDEAHKQHICSNRMCPLACELCERLCASTDHLHALDKDAAHLCGESHPCQALCSSSGICQIDTTPQSVEATFVGRHQTFQYTKYTQVAKRLPCVKSIPKGQREHFGNHIHSLELDPFHFCETQCGNCGYFCTLPRGHTQKVHETSHGSMSRTKWAVEQRGEKESTVDLNGRRFASQDDGAPMMCNLVCQSMGRHVHIDYCRTPQGVTCSGPGLEHNIARIAPDPRLPKDWITHSLFWKRSGFKDPYSRDDQVTFTKCDAMCPDPEHQATSTSAAQPSFCTLAMFHRPYEGSCTTTPGYVSHDGHLFSCKSPAVVRPVFNIIFAIDRSGSMSLQPSKPLHLTPRTNHISTTHNNRLGAVYLSLHEFWQSRQAALTNTVGSVQGTSHRRDSYSVILFNDAPMECINNDFARSPEQLLEAVLRYTANGGTNYGKTIEKAEEIMKKHWSAERPPVLIFLSDGECEVKDATVRSLCRAAISLGHPLSFHAIAFGPENRVLRRMVETAKEVERTAPGPSSGRPSRPHLASSYAEALDSVQLSETFLGIANSMRNTRGALIK